MAQGVCLHLPGSEDLPGSGFSCMHAHAVSTGVGSSWADAIRKSTSFQSAPCGICERRPTCCLLPASATLQIFHNADDDQSYFDYDNDAAENAMGSFLHDVGEVEFRGTWARFRVDMGTCDELALDVLLNMLLGFSKDFCGVRKVLVGGANRNWPVDDDDDEVSTEHVHVGGNTEGACAAGSWQRGLVSAANCCLVSIELQGKEYDIDPMKLPEGVAEELELLDEIAPELEKQMEKQRELLAAKRQGAAPGSLAAAAAEFQAESRGRSRAQPPATVRSAAEWGASLARGRPTRPSVGSSSDAQPSVRQGPIRQPGSSTKLPEGVSFISQEEFERSFPNRRGSAE
eukprot:360578-Chlamydomonas_euryale.AAC.6